MRPRRFAAAIALVALTVAPAAAAAPATPAIGRVRLLQSSAMSPTARRCLTLLREELTAGGFEVTIGEFAAGDEARWMVDPPTPEDGSLATITLIGNPDEQAAELWVVDGVAGHAVLRRLLVPAAAGTHDDEVLAIRTLEFLRASALELARGASAANSRPVASAPSGVEAAAQPMPPRSPSSVSFEIGLGLLESSGSLGPAYLPLLRLRASLPSVLEARLTVAGLGTRPELTNERGTATVASSFGLFELRSAFRRGHALRPAVGIGAGALVVQVEGSAKGLPYGPSSGHAWSALFDVGAGLTLSVSRRFAVAIEAHGQIATPYPTVRFSNQEAARIGRPALLASLTLVTSL